MVALVLLLLGLVTVAGLIGYVYYLETHLPPAEDYEAIVVLGAQVKEDGSLSVVLERRLTTALEAYRSDPVPVIVCGGQGVKEPRPEGEVMRDWLVGRGVPEQDVIAETTSVNTRENLLHAKAIMAERGLEKALVITSDYHVARALALCRQLEIPACGKGSPSKPEYFIKNHFREGLSWIKFWLESALCIPKG